MLGALAALGIVLVPSAAATGGTVRKYEACLQLSGSPACSSSNIDSALPAGATVGLVLTIKNHEASNKKLGSASLTAPTGLSITGIGMPSKGTATLEGNVIKLQSLDLSKTQSVTVGFAVAAPCSGADLAWSIAAQESPNFPGSGTFTLVKKTGLRSDIVQECRLVWGTEPETSAANTRITGSLYDPNGPNVTVQAYAGNNSPMSMLNTGSVLLTKTAGDFTSSSDDFVGTSENFLNGVATFSGLQATGAGAGFKLAGWSTGFTSTGDSGPFNISLAGTTCSGSCTLQASLGENDDTQVGVTGSGATFLAIDQSEIPASVTGPGGGCENYQSLGNAAFEVTGGWTGNSGVKELKYTISNALLPDSHFPLFIPLCAGGQRLAPDGSPISCAAEPAGTKGWLGAALGSNHWFNGQYRYARCNPVDGHWWGILAPWFVVNSKVHPSVTSWYFSEGDTTTYAIKVPAPWDWKMG